MAGGAARKTNPIRRQTFAISADGVKTSTGYFLELKLREA